MAFNPYPYGDPRYWQFEQLEEAKRANALAEQQNKLLDEQNWELEEANREAQKRWQSSATDQQRAEWAREHYKVFRLDQPLAVNPNKFSPAMRDELLSDRALFAKDPWQYHLLALARMKPGSPQYLAHQRVHQEQARFEKERRAKKPKRQKIKDVFDLDAMPMPDNPSRRGRFSSGGVKGFLLLLVIAWLALLVLTALMMLGLFVVSRVLGWSR